MSYSAPPASARRVAERTVPAGPQPSFLRRWGGPLAILFVAAIARLAVLGYPPHLVFDETYYVKDAWSLAHLGYEGCWPGDTSCWPANDKTTDANALFESGQVNVFRSAAEYPAHPPLGKWIIALGELAAGGAQNPYGWRLSVAIVGILAVALLMWIAHRLFATPLVTMVAGGLFAIDNQAIVMSRVGLLDNMVMFFALIGFALVIEDRLWGERRFAAWLSRKRLDLVDWGPALLFRPWLIGAGVAFGLCCGVKWSGIYFLAAFMLYAVGSDLFLRRRAGIRLWVPSTLVKQVPVVVVSMLPTALVAYLATWTGWFLTSGGYDRQYVEHGGARFTGALAWVPIPLQNLWAWTHEIYQFHVGLDSPHPYKAPAILWPLIARPTSMWYPEDGALCIDGRPGCVSAITDLPNPLIWYGAVAASIYLLVRFVRRREWQAGLILVAIGAGYLPWLQYPNRTMFFFYSIAFEPYMLLALAATVGLLVMRPPELASTEGVSDVAYRLAVRRRLVGVFLGASIVLSVFFYPISTGIPVPYWFWHIHMWSPTWI